MAHMEWTARENDTRLNLSAAYFAAYNWVVSTPRASGHWSPVNADGTTAIPQPASAGLPNPDETPAVRAGQALRGHASGASRNARVETPEVEEEETQPTCEVCGELEDDCSCWTCQGCNRKRSGDDGSCSCCECCDRCCECSCCENCGSYNPDVRSSCQSRNEDCGRCGECCNCEIEEEEDKGPRLKQRLRIEKPSNLLGYTENKLRRPVSVEVEYTSVEDMRGVLKSWASKTGAGLVGDSSIEGRYGTEVNTNPAAGNIFLQRMEELGDIVGDAEFDDSCGMHVHTDASDYSQWDLRKLIMLWSGVESTMYELISRKRWGNTYCAVSSWRYVRALLADATIRTVSEEGDDELIPALSWGERIAQAVYEHHGRRAHSPDGKYHKYNGSRYHGLNIHSYFFRKTIEVRLFESTTKVDTLKNWPLVCANIIDFASRSTERTIMEMLRSEVSGKGLLLSILPDAQRAWVLSTLEARKEARTKYNTQEETEKFIADIDKYRAQLIAGELWREKEKPAKVRERKPAKSTPVDGINSGYIDFAGTPISLETLRAARDQLLAGHYASRQFFTYATETPAADTVATPQVQERA
jgi:hypothetical protein